MRWLYSLQHRLSVTSAEALAVSTLAGLFLLGLGVRYVQQRPAPLAPGIYAETDSLFAEGAAAGAAAAPDTASSDTASSNTASSNTVSSNTVSSDTASSSAASNTASSKTAALPVVVPASPGRLNLNTATAAELDRLPRIGPALAQRILDYRASQGPFRSVRDLRRVRGIGEKTLAQLEPFLYVE